VDVRIGSSLLSFSMRFLVSLTLIAGASVPVASAQEPPKDVPAPPASPAQPTRIRVGGNVQQAKMVHIVQPLYPPIAVEAHITGTVVLHAIVARDGTIEQLEFVSGPPLLLKAAMEAVKQWVYEPTTLNGRPVEVDTTISVVFTLGAGNIATPGTDNSVATSSPPQMQNSIPPPPPPPPSRAATSYAVYADTIDGIKAQTQAVFELWGLEYREADYFKALHEFAMPDSKAWLTQTFGAEKAAELLPAYQTGFEKFEGHMTRVSKYWAKSPTSYLIVEPSPPPNPLNDSDEAPLTKTLVPLRIENFRFMVKTGQEDPSDWVFSFVYLDGRFRGVGGTYPFWDENWLHARDAKALENMRAGSNVPGFEGVAVDSSEAGPLRIFISPKAQALRLRKRVEPIYPEAAKKAGVEGTVLFQAIIAADGTVKELTLEDGDPMLASAAEDAIRKWQYDTTTHLGRIAEVDTAIAVEFKLPH
jgi:TonB family protein